MSWRQFQFFDSIPIRDPSFGTEHPLFSDPTLSAICATPNYLIISTQNSQLHFIGKEFNLVRSFRAYDKGWNITFIRGIPAAGLIVTIAERQGHPAILKAWDIEKILTKQLDKLNEASYHTQVHIKNGSNSYPITSFTHSSNLNVLGIGFANGVVVVVRGDLLRDRGSSQTIAYKSNDPITGLQLVKNNNYDPLLYVTTTNKVLVVPTTTTYHPGNETVLESSKGADLGTIDIEGDDVLIVGRSEGVVYYNLNGTQYTVSLELSKKKLYKFGKYLLIVTSNTTNSSSLVLNGYSEPTRIIIADTEHKLISFSNTIPSTVADVVELWGDVFVLSSDGILYKIHEKAIDQQIDIVISRDLYPIAIQIASKSVKSTKLLEIKRRYADYLFSKNETTEAMDQYIETITLGKTSEVINKYKDSKEVLNLARFLEAMLLARLATKEHVTLLLCAYCKLKDVERLNNFIEKYDQETNELVKIDFDLDVVIELCRDTNLLNQASRLAQNLGYSSLAVDILLKDLQDTSQALHYIKTLPVHEILRILVDFSRTLLDASPNATTALLIDVFTGKYNPVAKEAANGDISEKDGRVLLQSYQAFVKYMSNAASTITNSAGSDDETEYRNGYGHSHRTSMKSKNAFQPTYQPPKPRIIFPSFVDRPNEFVIFLEACAESYDLFEGNERDKNDILTTLFELYLTIGSASTDPEVKKSWERKAIELAKSDQNSIDPNTILLISDIFDFEEGQVLSREGPGLEIDLFRSYVASGDVDGVIQSLEKYGEDEPELYPLALMFYTSTDEIFRKAGEENFRKVLEKIKKDRILSPLEIIQTLGVNKIATIDLIKDYIVEFIEAEKKEIDVNKKLTSSYKVDADKKRQELFKIEKEPKTIQPNRCDTCSNKLDKETTHFLCGHSYHSHCLADTNSCPKCTPNREMITNIREAQRAIGERNDIFERALDESDNRFKVISDFFGKGAMDIVNYLFNEKS